MISIFTFQAGVLDKYLKTLTKYSALIFTIFSLLAIANTNARAQLSITSEATPFTIDFDNTVTGVNNGQFAGSGFTTSPTTGQLNSNAFSVLGLSDGDLPFGGTGTTGDFARGTSTGGVTTGGIYAFNVGGGFFPDNYILGFQASIADMTPGHIILKITNNTGVSASTIRVKYKIWELNNSTGDMSTALTFSYSADNTNYTSVPGLDFNTGGAADSPANWKSAAATHEKDYIIDLTGNPLANGSSFYLRFSTDDFSGTSGDRDEIGIDDIVVEINPPKDADSEATVITGVEEAGGTISSLKNNINNRRVVFYFQISDKGTADGLDTKVKTVRFVPDSTDVSWSSQIQGAILVDNNYNSYTPSSIDIQDTYMDLTFTEGVLTIPDGSNLLLRLEIYLNTSGIIDGGNLGFKITSANHGFIAYASGSSFATTFPADVISNQFTIDVTATELRFVTQPVNANTYEAMPVDVSVEATDVNGNRDLDYVSDISLSSSGTMTGDPIAVTAVSGLATWLQGTDPIVHTAAGTGLTLTASSGSLTSAVSNTFDIIQTADRVVFSGQPTTGSVNQPVGQITVSALKPDLTVDTTFTKNITLSKNSGPGIVSGTLTKAAVNGVAVFDDIQFDTPGDYTLLASSESYMATDISGNIKIGNFFEDFATCPPSGWLAVTINGNSWSCGSGYASVNGIGATNPTEAWYIMPSIDFGTMANQVLSFDSWTSGTDANHPRLQVLYSLDYSGTGNPNTATWTSLVFSPPVENSAGWAPSGLIDLSGITAPAYIAFKYTSSGTVAGSATEWRIDNVLITEDGCTAPTIQTSNLTFTGIQANQMTLNWDNGNGTGRLVIARQGSAPTEVPADGTNYTANAAYGTAGTEIGTSFVVYKGIGNSVTVTNLTQNNTYYFAAYEYNCDATGPTFNTVNPATGSQATNASDIIADGSYVYSELTDYANYAGVTNLTTTNTKGVFGMIIRDGGASNATDGLPTTLTSITFSTNGSGAVRAAGLFDSLGNLIGEKTINGITEFTLDNFTTPFSVADGTNANVELRVTFEDGVPDNQQIVFTVIGAIADPAGTVFDTPDAGGAQSSTTSPDNTIRVAANALYFVRVPQSTIPVDMDFTIEVEAVDTTNGRYSRDLDKTLTVSMIQGTGNLTTASFTQSTITGTALWNDLRYDTEENTIQFQVDDGGALSIQTNVLRSRRAFTIYTFTGAAGDETTFPPDFQPVNVTVNSISRGSGINPQTLSEAFNASGWPSSGLDQTSYYEVIITANYGYNFDLTGIELDHRKSASGPPDWEVRASINNFGSNLGGFQQTTGDEAWNTNTFLDFGTSIQGVPADTLRIYAYNSTSGLGTWAIDNLRIYGFATDVQAPSFVTGYPQYDSVAVDGFDLIVNLDEASVAYYVVQDTSIAAPDQLQVLAGLDGTGNPAVAADTIGVKVDSVDFYERVSGLSAASVYDVYYVLDDGVNQSLVISQTNVPTADLDTDLTAATQPVGTTIPSTSDNPADSVAVFSFSISDAGTNDGAPTHVTKLVFNQGGNNTVADWTTALGGARLYNNTTSASVQIANVTVSATSLTLDLAPGSLTIADGTSEQVTLFVWLTATVTDNEQLEFAIGGATHGNQTYFIGSQFNGTLTALTSNTFTIDVTATALNIISHTTTVPSNNSNLSLDVEAVDLNGNRDLDETSNVTVVLGQGVGTISANNPPPNLTQALAGGYVAWSNIRYDTNSEFITLITSSTTLEDDTTGLIEIGNPGDLIVSTTTTLTTNMAVNNVVIQSTGNLTIAPGVVLSVSADYTIDGVMNGQSGTVDFVATGNTLQTINGAATSADFYNITITNSGNQGVVAEIDINLHNTFSMAAGAIFDADGALNDKVFTLISTPAYTARLGALGDGATFNGNITWQRSLRTGPEGWRYIGTPIKGQTLGNISDDVWIQGIQENNPWAWTNIADYSEPLGTNGESGRDGWVDYSSNADNFNQGEGKKLWLWNYDYGLGEQVIVNTGAPVIGNGGDNVAGAGETYNFPLTFTPTSLGGGGWNFLANPYPSEIDWESTGFTRSNIEGDAVYIWNPNIQNYGTYSLGSSINGVTQYIASGQAFFVKSIDGSASISVSESAKSVNDGNSFLREGDEPLALLKLRITSDKNNIDETVVSFRSFATDGYDAAYDARKLAGGIVNLSSKIDEDHLMAINTMGALRGVKEVNMEIEPYYFGKYTFTFPEMKDMDPETIIRLRDEYLNKEMIISPSSKYNFVIAENTPATYEGRFSVQILAPVKFKFDDQVVAKAGREFVLPVYADQLADIISTSMTVGWEMSALEFVSIEDENPDLPGNFDFSDIDKGLIHFNNSNNAPVELPDNTKLFSIRFKALAGQPQAQLRFEKELMHVTAANDIEMPVGVKDMLLVILQNRNILGSVAAFEGQPVKDVKVLAEGDELIENLTGPTGAYKLDTYEKSSYLIYAQKAWAGDQADVVTTSDILMAKRHILQKEIFASPYQVVAADVNGSKSVTALDLTEMRKIVLGIDDSFRSGLDWLFIPQVYDLSNDPFAFDTKAEISLDDQDVNFDFIGVKVGDVDNSWADQGGARIASGQLELSLKNLALEGEYVEIPVRAVNFTDISGYQFTVSWDANQLELYDYENKAIEGHFNDQFVDQGTLTTMWDELNGKSLDLPEGETLFTLRFRVLNDRAVSEVAISSNLTTAMAFDSQLRSMTVKAVPARINFDELSNGHLGLKQNIPNPVVNSTRFEFRIVKAGKATFTIVNMLGEVIYEYRQDYKPGVYSFTWDRSQSRQPVTTGVYLYRLESNGEDVVKKMIVK